MASFLFLGPGWEQPFNLAEHMSKIINHWSFGGEGEGTQMEESDSWW